MDEEKIKLILKEMLEELQRILDSINEEKKKDSFDEGVFFSEIRGSLFGGSLKQSQVDGVSAKLKAFRERSWPLSWAAYALATSYHETARKMVPVREGLNASDAWRRRNLRYYPYYGRGDVQLTWETNYERADKELGLNGALVKNLDLALDKDVSAKILVRGMEDGWFSKGNSLKTRLPNPKASKAEFRQARRIINIMDKADLIADYAMKFQAALERAKY